MLRVLHLQSFPHLYFPSMSRTGGLVVVLKAWWCGAAIQVSWEQSVHSGMGSKYLVELLKAW